MLQFTIAPDCRTILCSGNRFLAENGCDRRENSCVG